MQKIRSIFFSQMVVICAIVFANIAIMAPSAYAICSCSCKGAGASAWSVQPGTVPGDAECAKECGKDVQSKCEVPSGGTSSAGKCLTCFCQTSDGAVGVGSLTPSACLAACTKQNSPAVCAYTIDQYPDRNLQCFTKTQCETPYAGKDKNLTGKKIGIFSDGESGIPKFQPPECISGSRYCFPNPQLATPLTLNVAIGSLTTAIDVAQYIQALYNWMIGAGVTIAIVLIMIGGLQYVLGAGGGSAAKTAKKRIADAIIGLILLLCVNLILKTVNPYLLSLKVPQLPMIRTVDLIRGQNDCKTLAEKYILTDEKGNVITDPDSKKCGDKAVVKETKDHTAVPSGSSCDFTTCPEGEGVCFAGKGKPQCMKCEEVVEGNDMKITPNSSVCSQLSLKNGNSAGFSDIHQCGWTRDKDVNEGFFKTGSFGSCAMINIDCNQVPSCGEYGSVGEVENTLSSDKLSGITDENDFACSVESLTQSGGGCGDFGIKSICQENPCSAAKGGKVGTGCVYSPAESKCLSTSEVITKPSVTNKTCDSIKCDAPSICVSDETKPEDGGPHFGCATCEQLTDGNALGQDGKKIIPSSSVCNQIPSTKFNRCKWSKADNLTNYNPFNDVGACAAIKIDCSEIKTCDKYQFVSATNATVAGDHWLYLIEPAVGDFSFQSICEENPCGVPGGCDGSGKACSAK